MHGKAFTSNNLKGRLDASKSPAQVEKVENQNTSMCQLSCTMLSKILSKIDKLHQELVTLRAYWKEREPRTEALQRQKSLLFGDLKYWVGQKDH